MKYLLVSDDNHKYPVQVMDVSQRPPKLVRKFPPGQEEQAMEWVTELYEKEEKQKEQKQITTNPDIHGGKAIEN